MAGEASPVLWLPHTRGRRSTWLIGVVAFVSLGFMPEPVVPGFQKFASIEASNEAFLVGSIILVAFAGTQLWRQVWPDFSSATAAWFPFICSVSIAAVLFPCLWGVGLLFNGEAGLDLPRIDWNLTLKTIYVGEAGFVAVTLASYLWTPPPDKLIKIQSALRTSRRLLKEVLAGRKLTEGEYDRLKSSLELVAATRLEDFDGYDEDRLPPISSWKEAASGLSKFFETADSSELPKHEALASVRDQYEKLREP